MCCSVLQCVAVAEDVGDDIEAEAGGVCVRVCVAVCCSVLQCFAVR